MWNSTQIEKKNQKIEKTLQSKAFVCGQISFPLTSFWSHFGFVLFLFPLSPILFVLVPSLNQILEKYFFP